MHSTQLLAKTMMVCFALALLAGSAIAAPAPTAMAGYNVTGMQGQTVQLSAKLSAVGPPVVPVAGKTIAFFVDALPVGNAVTDATGTARLSYAIAPAALIGAHPTQASFAGDANYVASLTNNTLTVNYPVATSITIDQANHIITADQTKTFTVHNSNGVDVTASCLLYMELAAGGSWAGTTFTPQLVGVWNVYAVMNTLVTQTTLTVTHGAVVVGGVNISPASAVVTTPGGSQQYIITLTDQMGNQWEETALQPVGSGGNGWYMAGHAAPFGTWGLPKNTYTTAPLDLGLTITIQLVYNGFPSNIASLACYSTVGAYLVWDRDDFNFYLTNDPAHPHTTGMLVPGSGTYNIAPGLRPVVIQMTGGTRDKTVRIMNCAVPNSLRVRWYFNGANLYRVYQYSSLGGVATWTKGNTSLVPPFPGLWNMVNNYAAVPVAPLQWQTLNSGTTLQP